MSSFSSVLLAIFGLCRIAFDQSREVPSLAASFFDPGYLEVGLTRFVQRMNAELYPARRSCVRQDTGRHSDDGFLVKAIVLEAPTTQNSSEHPPLSASQKSYRKGSLGPEDDE